MIIPILEPLKNGCCDTQTKRRTHRSRAPFRRWRASCSTSGASRIPCKISRRGSSAVRRVTMPRARRGSLYDNEGDDNKGDVVLTLADLLEHREPRRSNDDGRACCYRG